MEEGRICSSQDLLEIQIREIPVAFDDLSEITNEVVVVVSRLELVLDTARCFCVAAGQRRIMPWLVAMVCDYRVSRGRALHRQTPSIIYG